MMIDLSLWFMFPVSVAIASIAMMSGIGGAIMFSPIFMLLLGLDTLTSLTLGLFIEIFGFSSGVIGYWSKGLISFSIVKQLIIIGIPSAIVGVIVGKFIPVVILKILLALLLLYLSLQFLIYKKECKPKHPDCTGLADEQSTPLDVVPKSVKFTTMFGGLLLGAISSGLGEINEYNFIKKMRMSLPFASGTSVFLVATTAIVGIIVHLIIIIQRQEFSEFSRIGNILLFVIPGVIIGAQIGVVMSQKVNIKNLGRFVGVLFLLLVIAVIISML